MLSTVINRFGTVKLLPKASPALGLCFGWEPPAHHRQTESVGTPQRPIVNNCTTCVLKNLFSFWQLGSLPDIEPWLNAFFKRLMAGGNAYTYISQGTSTKGHTGLMMHLEGMQRVLRELGMAHILIPAGQNADPVRNWLQSGLPVMIWEGGVKTLADRDTVGHVYLVYTDPQKRIWCSDSREDKPFQVARERFNNKLNAGQSNYLVFLQKPERSRMAALIG